MLEKAAENTTECRKSTNEDVKEMSLLQRSIKIQIESCINVENRTFLTIYRNRILTEIHFILKSEENEKFRKKKKKAEVENMQNDNTKMYEAVKKKKQPEKTEEKTV